MLKSNINKLIIVEVIGARCGSSLVMGLLDRSGINTGNSDLHPIPDRWNPGGYYESIGIYSLIMCELKSITGVFTEIVDYKTRKKIALKYKDNFLDILNKEYKSKYPIAVKDCNGGLLAMFDCDDLFDVRIILLKRNIEDQCCSIYKMWNEEFKIKGHDREAFYKWMKEEYELMDIWIKESKLPCLEITFCQLIDNPIKSTNNICDFLNISILSESVIRDWINPKYSQSRSE